MKLPLNFTEDKVELLKVIYPVESKEKILELFPQYKWRNLQNIANHLKLKKKFCEIRKGNIENLFNNSNEAFYWLGLIASDGSITKDGTLKVDLIETDKDYLINMSKFLNSSFYLYPKYKNSTENSKGICRVKIKDKIEGKKLREFFNINDKKTYTSIDLKNVIEKEHFLCFLIGYIDGDGTISEKNYISIDGHKNIESLFLIFKERLIEILGFDDFTIFKYKDMVRLNLKITSTKLLNELKNNLEIPYMKRKWDKLNK